MIFQNFFAKLAGKKAADILKLQEASKMDSTKKWWQSKGVWTGVVTGLVAIYGSLAPGLNLPHIPEWVFTILGGMGVYTRVTADTKIG